MQIPEHTTVYEIHGPLFFAATDKMNGFVTDEDTRTLIIRMGDVATIDASAMKVL